MRPGRGRGAESSNLVERRTTGALSPTASAVLPLAGCGLHSLRTRDTLQITDLRDRRRELVVVERSGRSAIACKPRRPSTRQRGRRTLIAYRAGSVVADFAVGPLPGVAAPIVLQVGDTLVLTRDPAPGRPAQRNAAGRLTAPARIHCTLPAAFDHVHVGDRVWLDDGKIGGSVKANDGALIELVVTQVPPAGGRLRAEKGINFPDTELGLGALTEKDVDDLHEIAQFADLVALSFVRSPQDVLALEDRLRELGALHLGIVLKIENAAAFRNLPRILLASLRTPPVGVMVARGDLAVEIGFERLSEVQEEILWLCEAAHVPGTRRPRSSRAWPRGARRPAPR